jgi:vitamin K-dependent gamma-carboxylase
MFDPRVDILTTDWSPSSTPMRVMPLLVDLSDWRGRLKEIYKQYYSSAEDMDELMPTIVFAADFPGEGVLDFLGGGLGSRVS